MEKKVVHNTITKKIECYKTNWANKNNNINIIKQLEHLLNTADIDKITFNQLQKAALLEEFTSCHIPLTP